MNDNKQQEETPTQSVAISQRAPLREMLTTLKDAGPSFVELYARDIIEREVAMAKFDHNWRLARVFAESGFFSDIQQVTQAMAKIQLGESWNMVAADALQHIYFVNGKPAVQNEYLAAKMRDAGLDWDIEWKKSGEEITGCVLWPSRLTTEGWKPIMERENGVSVPASVSFTKADADRVSVKEDGKWIKLSEKSTYRAWAQDMYFWRAIARLRRRYATNILSGIMTRDEAEEIVTETPKQITAPKIPMDITEPILPSKSARTVPSAQIPGTTPWKDRTEMNSCFSAEKTRLGDKLFSEIQTKHDLMMGNLKPEDPKAVSFYQYLRKTHQPAGPDPAPVVLPGAEEDPF